MHRYFMYIALFFIIFLSIDVWKALWFTDAATGKKSFGMGIGTLVLAINVVLLAGYTFGCHSLRHFVGGLIAGYVFGEERGLRMMNGREDPNDPDHGVPDINLNGQSVRYGASIANGKGTKMARARGHGAVVHA